MRCLGGYRSNAEKGSLAGARACKCDPGGSVEAQAESGRAREAHWVSAAVRPNVDSRSAWKIGATAAAYRALPAGSK